MPRNSSPAKPTQNSKIVKARRNNTSSISNLPRLTLTEAEIHQRPVALSEKHTTKTHALKIHHTPSVNEMKGFYRTKESQFQDAQAKQFIQLIVDGHKKDSPYTLRFKAMGFANLPEALANSTNFRRLYLMIQCTQAIKTPEIEGIRIAELLHQHVSVLEGSEKECCLVFLPTIFVEAPGLFTRKSMDHRRLRVSAKTLEGFWSAVRADFKKLLKGDEIRSKIETEMVETRVTEGK